MTTVFILSSGRPTNKAWDKIPPFSRELFMNKALVKSRDGRTILDLQMEMLTRNNLTNIYISVGYRKDEIIEYCKEKEYNVKFVDDENWEFGVYSSGRTLWEIRELLLSVPTPIITLYHNSL